MPVGTVKFFNASKGYGFLQQEGGGEDAFVRISAVVKAGLRGPFGVGVAITPTRASKQFEPQ